MRLLALVTFLYLAPSPLPAQETILKVPDVGLMPIPQPSKQGLEQAVVDSMAHLEKSLAEAPATSAYEWQSLGQTHGRLARVYHAYSFFESAEPAYRNALVLEPGVFDWVYLLASLYQDEGRLAQAELYLIRGAALNQQYPPLWERLGEIYLQQGKLDQSQSAFEQLIKLNPKSSVAYFGMGQIARQKEQPELAVQHLTKALELLPDANRIRYVLGLAYRDLGEKDKAKEHLSLAGKVGPKENDPIYEEMRAMRAGSQVYAAEGSTAFNAGRYGEAAELYQAALKANPEDHSLYVNLGIALAKAGKVNDALAAFQKGGELDPDNPNLYYNMGLVLKQAGNQLRAASALKQAYKLAPKDLDVIFALGDLFSEAGMSQEAYQLYSAAREHHPRQEDLALRYVNVLLAAGAHAEADQFFRENLVAGSNAYKLKLLYARFYALCPELELRNGETAVQMARDAYKAGSTWRSHETMAFAFAESGDCGMAAEYQRKAIASAPQTQDFQATLQELQTRLRTYEKGEDCRPLTP